MIKNIVFDMGKVLVNYDSQRVCRHFMTDEAAIHNVNTSVFISPEWILLDMGLISVEAALEKMQQRLETDYEKEMAKLCMDHWHEYCMWEVDGMRELVTDLKRKGYGIYLCSNAAARLLSCYKEVIPAIECFDGVLFSAEVKCLKPQKEIYHHLFKRFELKPDECFFIDDLEMNIQGAKECGMDGFCFSETNVDELRKILYNM